MFVLKDVKLLEQWYILDDKVYRLRDPDEYYSSLFSRTNSTYDLNLNENQEWNDIYDKLIDLFLGVIHDKSNSKTNYEISLVSPIEMLFNYSTKLSPMGCMCVLRHFDGKLKCKGKEKSARAKPSSCHIVTYCIEIIFRY